MHAYLYAFIFVLHFHVFIALQFIPLLFDPSLIYLSFYCHFIHLFNSPLLSPPPPLNVHIQVRQHYFVSAVTQKPVLSYTPFDKAVDHILYPDYAKVGYRLCATPHYHSLILIMLCYDARYIDTPLIVMASTWNTAGISYRCFTFNCMFAFLYFIYFSLHFFSLRPFLNLPPSLPPPLLPGGAYPNESHTYGQEGHWRQVPLCGRSAGRHGPHQNQCTHI